MSPTTMALPEDRPVIPWDEDPVVLGLHHQREEDRPMHDNADMPVETASADEILAFERREKQRQDAEAKAAWEHASFKDKLNALPEMPDAKAYEVDIEWRQAETPPPPVNMDPTPKIDAVTEEDRTHAIQVDFFIKGSCFGGDLPRLPWIDDAHASAVGKLLEAYDEARILADELLAVRQQLHTSKNDADRMEKLLSMTLNRETARNFELTRQINELRALVKSVGAERDHQRGLYEAGVRERVRLTSERNDALDRNSRLEAEISDLYRRWQDARRLVRRQKRALKAKVVVTFDKAPKKGRRFTVETRH